MAEDRDTHSELGGGQPFSAGNLKGYELGKSPADEAMLRHVSAAPSPRHQRSDAALDPHAGSSREHASIPTVRGPYPSATEPGTAGTEAPETPHVPAAAPAETANGAERQDPRPPFVRERRPHRTQPPVDDIQADEALAHEYSHESGYTMSNHRPVSSSTYRRSRSDMSKVKKELKYGQYLSVPKGSREIFGSHDKVRRHQIQVAVIALVAIVVVIALFLLTQH